MTIVRTDLDLSEAFWARVDKRDADECWPWIGFVERNGYGSIRHRGQKHYAHRIAVLLTGREIPDGQDVRHRCDRRDCVNASHLDTGTRAQNMADCTERGRHNKPRGERHWRARLSASDVVAIRARRARGESTKSIAAAFGVHRVTVLRIAKGEWRQEVAADAN